MVDTDDTRRMIHDGRRTTPRVWHKLPTGELKNLYDNTVKPFNLEALNISILPFVDILAAF